jgi:predicted HicB family RNase H-like nuclease
MPVQYPSHLYIRIDRPLRADLVSAADTAGQSVSALARLLLEAALADSRYTGRAALTRPLDSSQ